MEKITILKNGTIVTDTNEYLADVKIEKGKIVEIGTIEDIVGAEVINTSGSFLIPGLIDAHTHIEMGQGATKTADDFVTGSKAAIAGGTTTILDFATQEKQGTLKEALETWKSMGKDRSYCDYGFHMAITDWNKNTEKEMADMVKEGVSSFKMYMAYKETLQVEDDVIYKALKRSVQIGGLIGFHCENGDLITALVGEALSAGQTGPYYHMITRPPEVESEAIFRLTQIAKLAKSPMWVVHLSTKEGLDIIREMKAQGIHIVTETCPQYLVLDHSCYGHPEETNFEAGKFVISPPLRDPESVQALWDGLNTKDIDFVSTDHCPFNFNGQKDLGKDDFSKIPNGGPGIEHRLQLMHTYGVKEEKMTMSDLVHFCSTQPAKTFGLAHKGNIAVGMDADIVIFDPNHKETISAKTQVQNVDYTPYEGLEVFGKVQQVFLRGQSVYANREFGEAPQGQYVSREKFISDSH